MSDYSLIIYNLITSVTCDTTESTLNTRKLAKNSWTYNSHPYDG